MMQAVEMQNQGLFMGCEEVLERAGMSPKPSSKSQQQPGDISPTGSKENHTSSLVGNQNNLVLTPGSSYWMSTAANLLHEPQSGATAVPDAIQRAAQMKVGRGVDNTTSKVGNNAQQEPSADANLLTSPSSYLLKECR